MKYRIYWKTGLISSLEGDDIVSAFNKSIYSENQLSIISFFKDETIDTKHKWNSKTLDWIEIINENEDEIIQKENEANFESMKKMCKIH